MRSNLTFNEMCAELGKSHLYVRQFMHDFELPLADKKIGYSASYVGILRKLVSLRCFSVPLHDIHDLLKKEKKILELLHFDSMSNSSTWFLDHCLDGARSPSRLVLTGFDLGFPITANAIQSNLNFRERERELFASAEMGEDVRHLLQRYLARVEAVARTVRAETRVLENALCWAEHAFA